MAQTSQNSFPRFQRLNLSLIPNPTSEIDVEMMEAGSAPDLPPGRLIIAFDFGTTFSSVAYARIGEDTPRDTVSITDVKCISRYPDDRPQPGVTFGWEPREDVPTELWYSILQSSKNKQPDYSNTQMSGYEEANDDAAFSDASSDISCLFPGDADISTDEDEANGEKDRRAEPLFWGFGVQKQLKHIDIQKVGTRRITRFKLMLDEKSVETEVIRAELLPVLKNLKRAKLIGRNSDVISDYLEQLFKHTKVELQRLNKYTVNTPIEFVLCVPAVWPASACRIMQAAMSAAATRSELGTMVDGNLTDLFIISEPEAAAACVLAEDNNDIYENETIVILDAGGGTVDAVTYQVTKSHPLRLSAEVVAPGSKLCGASYINERFEKLLLKRLKREIYLEKNGKTIKSIVEGKVIDFENGEKRLIDTASENFETAPIWIDDLKANSAKRFYQNRIGMSKREMVWVFQESLDMTAKLLIEQLEMAKAKGAVVQKVILIGGFGQSPSLQTCLRNVLMAEQNIHGQHIQLLLSRDASTVVARGAVLRALNKNHGPERITSCSYGFLISEPYEPEEYAAHKNSRCVIDKADGERYIDGTIKWLIQKVVYHGDPLLASEEFSITVKHTFTPKATSFICKEVLYVSDSNHEPHYRQTHVMNKAAEIAGSIEADMTFLRDEGHIQTVPPSVFSKYSGPKGQRHWEVTFDLVMIIDGRNLRYEARWPPSNSPEAKVHSQSVLQKGQTCIAAAFQPGTA